VEVEQPADPMVREPQVRHELGPKERGQLLDRLPLDDDAPLDDEFDAEPRVNALTPLPVIGGSTGRATQRPPATSS
jgi:hypothetical protein